MFLEGKIIFKELQTNSDIRDREVRVIDENGVQLGVMSAIKANEIADYRNLDLVKVSPDANPPVCKFMDYGKFRFDALKSEKDARKNQTTQEAKEIQLSAVIDVGDMKTKAKKTMEILSEGIKVKVSIRMKGRQQAHPEISFGVMKDFIELIKEKGFVEKEAKQEGRNIAMTLAPIKK